MGRRTDLVLAVLTAACVLPVATAGAQLPALPTNDLQGVLGLVGGFTPLPVAVQRNAEPALEPSPAATCGPGSTPLEGEQGRVPLSAVNSPQAAKGWTCNLKVIGTHPTPGGFRVWRYVDGAGHACAFYDTSIAGAINVVSLGGGPGQGTAVLDMTDPAHPIQTDLLTAPGTLSPHESLNFNAKRGLLGAETANVGTEPGILSLYDVTQDCRHPVLQSNTLVGPVGHESGFSPDGNTFWVGGLQGIIAVDVTNPKAPRTIRTINAFAHGLNLSDDGNTLYDTNPVDGGLTIMDVSDIQARRPDPHVYELSRLNWQSVSIPQNTNPMTIDGHPYLLEFDEFAMRFNPPTIDDEVGAARIIDLADVRHPKVVSNLRLAINQQAAHRAAQLDPSFIPEPGLIYGAHYCNVPREVDPEIVACSFLNSGLRIFNVQDPLHPREVAYFVSPPGSSQGNRADAAFSQPAFDPARREVDFTDATTGFYALKLDDDVWPSPLAPPAKATKACTSRRTVVVHIRRPRAGRIAAATVTVAGKRLKVRRSGGRFLVTVNLRGKPRSTVRVKISVRTTIGRRYSDSRTYRPC